MSNARMLRAEPNVQWKDYASAPTSWSALDARLTRLVGRPVVALPSVRVGICWALEFLGMRRHSDQVMVPKFMGRCILNSINRVAFPVEELTRTTRALVPVHQYGFRQRLDLIDAACRERGIPYIEDSPFIVEESESLGMGALVKFVGLSKVLPMLKGGFAVSDDAGLLAHVRVRRSERSPWSWTVLGIMASLRWSPDAPTHPNWAELAYEMYVESAGDNAALRMNFSAALRSFADFERVVRARVQLLRARLPVDVLVPDAARLAAFALVRGGENSTAVAAVFRGHGLDSGVYNFDVDRNMLAPRYEPVSLLSLNPRIPDATFTSTVDGLAAALGSTR